MFFTEGSLRKKNSVKMRPNSALNLCFDDDNLLAVLHFAKSHIYWESDERCCQLRRQLRLDSERPDHAVYTKQSSTYDTYGV